MRRETKVFNMDRDLLAKLQSQYPRLSNNEIFEWILLEEDVKKKRCKEHNFNMKLYERACQFIHYMRNVDSRLSPSWREICHQEKIDAESARIILEE